MCGVAVGYLVGLVDTVLNDDVAIGVAVLTQALKRLQRQLDDGLPAPDATLTVAHLFERWYTDVLRHQVARAPL